MDENNVFNSFSFQKWADYVRKEKIENEILRQRMEQVTRLRTKLVRERHLRDQADLLTDEDIDKVIGYLGAGYSLNAGGGASNSLAPPLAAGSGIYSVQNPELSASLANMGGGKLSEKVVFNYAPKDDEYIFNEIKQFYAKTHSLSGLHETIPVKFKYNHRYSNDANFLVSERKTVNPKSRFYKFEYNRKFNE